MFFFDFLYFLEIIFMIFLYFSVTDQLNVTNSLFPLT